MRRRHPAWLAAALGLLALLAYANSFQADLTVDNKLIIGLDPRIQSVSAGNLRLIFSENYWWPFARGDLYRPVTTLTYLFNYAVLGNGVSPLGYHVVNLALHIANVVLGFFLVRRLGASSPIAWLAAALFAVHPIQTEAVTNIVGRADLLATCAVFSAALCYVQAAAQSGARKSWSLASAGALTCAGVVAKESALAALGFAVLYDLLWRWPASKGETPRIRLRTAVRTFGLRDWTIFFPAIALFWWTRFQLGPALAPAGLAFTDNPILFATPLQGWLTAIGVLGRYLALLVFPRRLACDYSYGQIPLYGEENAAGDRMIPWLSLLLLLGLAWWVIRRREAHRLAAWGVAFFFITLLPTSNLVVRIGAIMAERFLYLPSLGIFTAVAVGLAALARHAVARLAPPRSFSVLVRSWALPAVLLVALTARTWARNRDWRNEETLWRSAVLAVPESFKAQLNYAMAIWGGSQTEAALDVAIARARLGLHILERAPLPLPRRPQSLFTQLGALYRTKGEFLLGRGLAAEAHAFFADAVTLLERAREVDRYQAEWFQRTSAGRASAATSILPLENIQIYLELAACQMHLRNWSALESAAQHIQRDAPSSPNGYAFQAVAQANTQRDDAAAIHFFAALLLDSNDAEVRANLAGCHERLGIRPSPVTGAADWRVDTSDPRVSRQLGEAFRLLVATHLAAHRPREAAELSALAWQRFQIPIGLPARAENP